MRKTNDHELGESSYDRRKSGFLGSKTTIGCEEVPSVC